MIYFSPQGVETIKQYPGDHWGKIFSPTRLSPVSIPWIMDNDAYSGNFNPAVFFAALKKMSPYRKHCKFIVAPDVRFNPISTIQNFKYFAWKIKDLGFPVAFVAQNGQESYDLPPEFDALFLAGSTDWKLSPAADRVIKTAKDRGLWIHAAPVNSQKRIKHFQLIGVDSVDGTLISYEPNNAIRLINNQLKQPPLFRL